MAHDRRVPSRSAQRLRQWPPGSRPTAHRSGSGARIANALRRSRSEPDVQHLAAPLRQRRAGWALAARWRLETASSAALADDVRVPAEDGTGGCRASLAVPRAPHRADQDERAPGRIRVDQRLGSCEVEDRPAAWLLRALCVEVAHGVVANPSRGSPRVIPGTTRSAHVTPTTLLRRSHEPAEDRARPRSLLRRREATAGYWSRWSMSPWRLVAGSFSAPLGGLHRSEPPGGGAASASRPSETPKVRAATTVTTAKARAAEPRGIRRGIRAAYDRSVRSRGAQRETRRLR